MAADDGHRDCLGHHPDGLSHKCVCAQHVQLRHAQQLAWVVCARPAQSVQDISAFLSYPQSILTCTGQHQRTHAAEGATSVGAASSGHLAVEHADCSCMTCAPLPHALEEKLPNITSILANVDLSNQAMKLGRTSPSVRRLACLCMTLQNKRRADESTF
jgi:hypothetical protein